MSDSDNDDNNNNNKKGRNGATVNQGKNPQVHKGRASIGPYDPHTRKPATPFTLK